ncbi:unnamed protein product [Heterobilharzia americana]|nr:unnamed protein product [Heterobilharzia americana]
MWQQNGTLYTLWPFVMLKNIKTHHCRIYTERPNHSQGVYEDDYLMALGMQCEDYIQYLSLNENIESKTHLRHDEKRSMTLDKNTSSEQDSNTTIPCEFCQSTYPVDEISEHQVMCMLQNNSTDLSTEGVTRFRGPTFQPIINSKTNCNYRTVSKATELTSVKSANDPISMKSQNLNHLIPVSKKSPQSSSSQTLSSSILKVNEKISKNDKNRICAPNKLSSDKNTSIYKTSNQFKSINMRSNVSSGNVKALVLSKTPLNSWKKSDSSSNANS